MALVTTPSASEGIAKSIKGAQGLFGETNKVQSGLETVSYSPIDEYESSLSEEEIIELVDLWKKSYSVYFTPIDETQKLAFDYWIGKQRGDDVGAGDRVTNNSPLVDNKIFEALETFLPIATRANPDPLIQADPSETGQQISKAVKAAIVYLSDILKLRRKLARMVRHWALYRLGVIKISWDVHLKTIKTDVVNARRLIFDKDGYIDEGGHFIGEYIGEKKKTTAQVLTELFPKKKADIIIKAQGKMGTKLEYYEWWYCGTDVFYTLDNIVLGKFKNPNWNYDIPEKIVNPTKDEYESNTDESVPQESKEPQVSQPQIIPGVEGRNFMKKREAPYVFLSVFSVGLHPHDETSLILQNISTQDLINRRMRQIDKNVESMNNGLIVSGKSFTEEQAAGAASALRRGQAIRVPDGDVNSAVKRDPPPPLPRDIFQNLEDGRNELRAIFGTSGSTPEAMENQDTVRGKIMVSQQDSSRIGGGITEQLEQVADTIYNWWVQFMFVYYDEPHFALAAGQTGGFELFQLKNTDLALIKTLDITVKEGSLIPKDSLTQRNEAIDLWGQGAIDPLTFYKRLDFPDPVNQTQQLMLWQLYQKGAIPPQAYLPSFQMPQPQGQPMPPPPGVGGPAVSPPGNQGVVNPQSTQPPEQAISQQLIRSVPIQK